MKYSTRTPTDSANFDIAAEAVAMYRFLARVEAEFHDLLRGCDRDELEVISYHTNIPVRTLYRWRAQSDITSI